MRTRRPGFQHHHILPVSLLNRPQIGGFLGELRGHGFTLADRQRNCLWLPSVEAIALVNGHALHRGPHPHYTDVVAARVERLRGRAGRGDLDQPATIARLARLQNAMTRVLTGHGPRLLTLNRHDPLRLFADYAALDDAITRMLSQPTVRAT